MNKARHATLQDGSGLTLELDERIGTSHALLDIAGWIEGSGVEVEKVERLGDGTFLGELRRQGRTLNLAGKRWLASRQEVVAFSRAVSAAFSSTATGTLRVTSPDDEDLTAEHITLDGRPRVRHGFTDLSVDYELPLISTDPYLYGIPQASQASTGAIGQGLEYPLFDDEESGTTTGVLEYGEQPPAPTPLTNDGNATAYPSIRIVGEFPSGFALDVASGGREFGVTFRGDVGYLAPVTVDMAGALTVDGVDQSWALIRRDWGGVEPGEQMTIRLSSLVEGGSGTATVTLRSTYL